MAAFNSYLGICFFGLFTWESANAIRKRSPILLLSTCFAFFIITLVILALFPFNPNYSGFILERLPFYLLVLVDVVLLWNFTLMTNSQDKAPFKLNVVAASSLIIADWFFLYAIPGISSKVVDSGQMVSLFTLALPTILAWEGLMDDGPFEKGKKLKMSIMKVAAVILISIIAWFFAVLFGFIGMSS